MDIHRPKAVHGWRELAVEIAIIVLGILIALGLEQAVEQIHERNVAAESRDAIRVEAERDLGLLALRQSQHACLIRRLGEVDAILASAAAGKPFQRPTWIGRPRLLPISDFNWNAAASSGRRSLFSASEQTSYAELFVRVLQVQKLLDQEEMLWATLRELESPRPLTALQIDRLTAAKAQASYIVWRINFITDRMMDAAKPLGLRPGKDLGFVTSIQHPSACVPIDTPRETALKMIDNPSGEP